MEFNPSEAIIDKAAELFDYPPLQFETIVLNDSKLAASLSAHGLEFFEKKIAELNAVPEKERGNYCAGLKRSILGKGTKELLNMTEKMQRY